MAPTLSALIFTAAGQHISVSECVIMVIKEPKQWNKISNFKYAHLFIVGLIQ